MKFLDSGEINLEKLDKYFEEHVHDKEWLRLLEENFKTCKEKVGNNLSTLQTKWGTLNVTKDQCDFRIPSVTDCVNLKLFLVKIIRASLTNLL